MSFAKKLLGGGGGSKNVGRRAAERANVFTQQGIDELRRQFDIGQTNFQDILGREQGVFDVGLERAEAADLLEQERFGRAAELEQERFGRATGLEQERFDLARNLEQERFDIGQQNLQRGVGLAKSGARGLDPFVAAGRRGLGLFEQGLTPGGLDARLAELTSTDTFGTLVAERQRAAQGQLAAGGLTRSGTGLAEAARIPTDLALALEQQLSQRQFGLGQLGQQSAAQRGNILAGAGGLLASAAGLRGGVGFGSPGLGLGSGVGVGGAGRGPTFIPGSFGGGGQGGQNAAAIAQLFAQQGQNVSSGALADAQARAKQSSGLLGGLGSLAGTFFGPAGTAIGGAIGSGVKNFINSDPALKENIEQISEIGDLNLYQWDWIPLVKDTFVADFGNIGFMADEVKEKYPEYVAELHGFLAIDYPALLDRLERDFSNAVMKEAI